jgi:hypothetical protein
VTGISRDRDLASALTLSPRPSPAMWMPSSRVASPAAGRGRGRSGYPPGSCWCRVIAQSTSVWSRDFPGLPGRRRAAPAASRPSRRAGPLRSADPRRVMGPCAKRPPPTRRRRAPGAARRATGPRHSPAPS